MDIKTSTMSFHVGYMCKYCELMFKSTHEFCTHKIEFHLPQLTKSRCIVFEESIVEPTETQLTNFRKVVRIVQVQPQFKNKFEDNICVAETETQGTSDPVFISETVETCTNLKKIDNPVSVLALRNGGHPKPKNNNSEIKTEWVEETLIKYEPSQQIEDVIVNYANSVTDPQEICYYNKAETDLNFIEHEADAAADVDPTTQPQVTHLHHNQPEHSDVTQSTESISLSTFTAETERQYFIENQTDSDDDIICLDDDPLPSTSNKIPKATTGPTTTATAEINNSVFSQLALKCLICSKQFSSSTQLGIHVGICKLYNSRQTVALTEPAGALVVRGREAPIVRGDILMVKCQECFKLIRSHNFKKHAKWHQFRVGPRYACHICGKTFGNKNNLDQHAGVHSDEAPNKCTFPGCHSAFKYKAGLYKHLKRHAL